MTVRLVAIVVTFNRVEQLRRTVARLLDDPVDHIIVVDNGSTDGSREWLASQPQDRLHPIFPPENGGGAAGFEIGLRACVADFDPDWCVVMDDDARPKPGAIARFLANYTPCADAVAAAVTYPKGGICEMNRPWQNPFAHADVFLRTVFGGGRAAFHIPDAAYAATGPRLIDGGSFVGLFLSRRALQMAGYPDGRLFIYGDDVLYTLGLSKAGGRILFAPDIGFEHDCETQTANGIFLPLWKTYFYRRNISFVYRMVVGPVLFWPLMLLMVPMWFLAARRLSPDLRPGYRRVLRAAVVDAILNRRGRKLAEVRSLSDDPAPHKRLG